MLNPVPLGWIGAGTGPILNIADGVALGLEGNLKMVARGGTAKLEERPAVLWTIGPNDPGRNRQDKGGRVQRS